MLDKIKIRKSEIEKFKHICRKESNTSDEEVCYKITRNFNLGKVINVRENGYVVKFGTFCMLYRDGEIIFIYRDLSRPTKINVYEKYKYDYIHKGSEYANKKYSA